MRITYDRVRRAATIAERGLDFADAAEVFSGLHATLADDRVDYGETRFISAGYLRRRLLVLVWTPRGTARHVISMRHAHAKEARRWIQHLGQG